MRVSRKDTKELDSACVYRLQQLGVTRKQIAEALGVTTTCIGYIRTMTTQLADAKRPALYALLQKKLDEEAAFRSILERAKAEEKLNE